MKDLVESLTGQWAEGRKVLYTSWLPEKEHTSVCPLSWRPILNETALLLSYNWSYENRNQQGEMFLVYDDKEDEYSAAWVDTWHQARFPMSLKGEKIDDVINLNGTFPAGPSEPDWGWRIRVFPVIDDICKLEMYVLPPEDKGEEAIAVRIEAS